MEYKLIIRAEAQNDIVEIMNWYSEKKKNLELDFFIEISDVLDYICNYPRHFQKRYKNTRIRFTKKFQYGVHYLVENDSIIVLAVIHTKRKPKF